MKGAWHEGKMYRAKQTGKWWGWVCAFKTPLQKQHQQNKQKQYLRYIFTAYIMKYKGFLCTICFKYIIVQYNNYAVVITVFRFF